MSTLPTMFAYFLLALGAFGVLTSTIFLCMALAGARHHRSYCERLKAKWAKEGANSQKSILPVSVLMPLHGADQHLRADLEQFFQQQHPEYELLFAARTSDDAGIKIVEELAAAHPQVKVRTFAVGDPPFPNAKINSLITLVREAKHELLVMCDSDVLVDADYLREVTRVFADDEKSDPLQKKVGMATCLYRGRHTRG